MKNTRMSVTSEDEVIKLLVELIGAKSTQKILENLGGSFVWIPPAEVQKSSSRHYLKGIL